ncbi:MAG: DUF5659 domain-containing protein [Candidatus Kuenenbacteria bacterium]
MENQNFQTTDFYTAVFLLANGFKLIEIDKTNPRRFCFVFQDQENRGKLLEDYFNGNARIDPRQFVSSIKELKTLMYNDAL